MKNNVKPNEENILKMKKLSLAMKKMDLEVKDVSNSISIPQGTIYNYINGSRGMSLEFVERFCSFYKIDANHLISDSISLEEYKSSFEENNKKMSGNSDGKNVRQLSGNSEKVSGNSENEQENKVSIDYYPDVFLAAGYNGSAISETKEIVEVPKYLLNGLDTRGVVMLNVVGDSMEPKMADGDKILVKPSRDNTLKPAIYACWLNNNLIVKQLQWVGFNLLEVKSLNSQFNTYMLDLKNRDDNAFKIIGEVVFVFHKM